MDRTAVLSRINIHEVKEEGQGMDVPRLRYREVFLVRERTAHFPPVTGGMTKDANGLNQKNGRRRETKGQEKVCRCTPSTAL